MLIFVLGLCAFAASIAAKSVDPTITSIAGDMMVPVTSAAMVVSAYALAYACSQPILGPLGDRFGRTLFIRLSMALLFACLIAAALAPNLSSLMAARTLAGVAGAATVPMALALIGDRVSAEKRQTVISHFLAANLSGQLLGTSAAGFITEWFGWRLVFWLNASIALLAMIAAFAALRESGARSTKPLTVKGVASQYRAICRHPMALICFIGVCAEGVAIYGATPFLSAILIDQQLGGAVEAGLIIAALGVGGLAYSACSGVIVRAMRRALLIAVGGSVSGLAVAGVLGAWRWEVEAALFFVLGFNFYMMHTALYAEASELFPAARASTMSLLSFSFFAGQAIGPAAFGATLASSGTAAALAQSACILILVSGAVAIAYPTLAKRTTIPVSACRPTVFSAEPRRSS